MQQLERIQQMEELYDRVEKVLKELDLSLEQYQETFPLINELANYYSCDLWKQDFNDDSLGKFPADLKRGVLSEDGVYNLLDLNSELFNKMKEIIKIRELNE